MRIVRTLSIAAAALFALLAATPADALGNRVFLSITGNDTADCANPLTPCLTFLGALAQVNVGGEVIAEATGGYGPLNITQAVTISGPPGIVMYSGVQATVNAPGATVVLRGLTIDGGGAVGDGILVQAIDSLYVENCVISHFAVYTPFGGSGIQLNFSSQGTFNLYVKDSTFQNNAFAGIAAGPMVGPGRVSIDHCRFEGNQRGLWVGGITSWVIATVRNSVVSGNGVSGFNVAGAGELNVENCLVSSNGVGIRSGQQGSQISPVVRVSNTTVTDNTTGLSAPDTGLILSRGNNTVEGNGTDGAFTGTYSAK